MANERIMRTHRQKRKDAGLCVDCGKPAKIKNEKPTTRCGDCAKKLYKRISKYRKANSHYHYKTAIWRLKLKISVIGHYSNNTFCCSCCGESEFRFLQLDHINGGGCKHRKSIGSSSHNLYKLLVDSEFPDGYRVLCGNCNHATYFYGVCPHKTKPITSDMINNMSVDELYCVLNVHTIHRAGLASQKENEE